MSAQLKTAAPAPKEIKGEGFAEFLQAHDIAKNHGFIPAVILPLSQAFWLPARLLVSQPGPPVFPLVQKLFAALFASLRTSSGDLFSDEDKATWVIDFGVAYALSLVAGTPHGSPPSPDVGKVLDELQRTLKGKVSMFVFG